MSIRDNPLFTRATGFMLAVFALYMALTLSSYNPADPSLNRATSLAASNLGGNFGALIADLTFQTLGLAGWLLALVPLAWGVKAMKGEGVSLWWLRFCALLAGMVFGAMVLAYFPSPVSWPITAGLGGSIGALLQAKAALVVGKWVAAFLAFTLAAVCAAAAFGMHIDEWRGIGQQFVRGAMVIYALVQSVIPRRAQAEDENEENEEEEEYHEPWYERLMFWRRGEAAEDEEEEEEEEEEYEEEEEDEDEEEEEEPEPRQRTARVAKKEKPEKTKAAPKAQPSFALNQGDYEIPPLALLAPAKAKKNTVSEAALQQNARLLESVLNDFGVNGEIVEIRPGPVVTLYELEPAAGTKSSRVIGLADDIARSMSAISARIAVIPGRNAIGIELPNATRETVLLRQMLEAEAFESSEAKLPLALGKDIGGAPIIADLARMPHLLVAGTTGSGKSVAVNTMIMSLVYRLTPDECKFIMIDPKMLELSIYDGIPHLLSPVVTEPGKAVVALKWTVKEMENRYRLMSSLSVRNIDGYNKKIREAKAKGNQLSRNVQTGFDSETGEPVYEDVPIDMTELPFIVVIVDEMADLMIVAGKEIEGSIQRLAQMARAAGIHIIMATQRPSVDVITGVIKANFPTRISFQVTSRIDSRTILGEQGAEQLLGQGDMLYMAGGGRITRVHGPFVADKEVETVVAHLKAQGTPVYIEDVTRDDSEEGMFGDEGQEKDELYDQAAAIVIRDRKASTSYVQRCLKIGYNRAASIIERMEREGIVGPANHVGKREVLARESA